MKAIQLQRAAVLALLSSGAAFAQNDECATATVITAGPAAFDTTAATLSPEAWPCAASTAPDVWFRYTPTISNQATVSLCGGATYDTALQILSGSCGSLTSVICNDDFCGLQSEASFTALVGTTYYIRVGGFGAAASGAGTVTLTEGPPPPVPTLAIVNNLPGTFIDISTTGTALNLTDDAEVDITTTIGNSLLAAGTARVGSNGGVRFAGAGTELGFTNAAIPAAAAFSLTSQSLLAFWDDFNTAGGTIGNIFWQETQGRLIIQWEDAGFFGAATEFATFQIQVPSSGPAFAQFIYQDIAGVRANNGGSATIGYQGGGVQNDVQWSFDSAGSVGNGVVLSLVPIGNVGVGSNYCNAVANSTGSTGEIAGAGSASVGANDLTLEASSLPNNAFGFFLTSRTQGLVNQPGGSQGVLCLGGQIGRYVGAGQIKNSGATGSFELLLNLTQTPTPTGLVAIAAGETWNFQAWYRDAVGGVATSNFTNGLSVPFVQ